MIWGQVWGETGIDRLYKTPSSGVEGLEATKVPLSCCEGETVRSLTFVVGQTGGQGVFCPAVGTHKRQVGRKEREARGRGCSRGKECCQVRGWRSSVAKLCFSLDGFGANCVSLLVRQRALLRCCGPSRLMCCGWARVMVWHGVRPCL